MEKIGPLIIDLEDISLSAEEKELLSHPLIGGVVLFSRNYTDLGQLQDLCHQIHLIKPTLLVMVDQEGGRVQRFRKDFTPLPSMYTFGQLFTEEAARARHLIKECAWLMAQELLIAGVDCNLAPVLDLYSDASQVIGDRAFHADATVVTQLAIAFIQGLHEAGMGSVGKHFPGHGSIIYDSHTMLAKDSRSFAAIASTDLLPFANMIKTGITAIMASHIIYTEIDALPVGFSPFWLKKILRSQLNFNGVILTDDLNMEGANISKHFVDRVKAAKEAGCDFVLLCNNRKGVIEVLNELSNISYLVEKEKWAILKGNRKTIKGPLNEQVRWRAARELIASQN